MTEEKTREGTKRIDTTHNLEDSISDEITEKTKEAITHK
jgi:hypothetical protein